MSIEMENPQTVKEMVDAAWNHVEQIRLALTLGSRERAEKSIGEAARLLSVAMEKLEEEKK